MIKLTTLNQNTQVEGFNDPPKLDIHVRPECIVSVQQAPRRFGGGCFITLTNDKEYYVFESIDHVMQHMV